jgi:hypothetical protein
MAFPFLTSRLSVSTRKESGEYFPGDKVEGSVKLSSLREVRARSISVSLSCAEWVGPGKAGGKRREGEETSVWKKEKKLGGSHGYASGEWEFAFVIPKDAMPTITPEPSRPHPTEGAGLKWYLHAKMDIPASIDLHAYKQVFVY